LFKRTIIAIVFLLVLFLGALQFPSLFIDFQLEYQGYELYASEPLELTDDIRGVLDSVTSILEKSEFYREDQVLELYFIKGSFYEKMAEFLGAKNIASSRFDKHIYFGRPDFEKKKLVKEESKLGWVNLIQIISHEGVHSQMYGGHSTLGVMQTPSWINEGYSEYISYAPVRTKKEYSLSSLHDKYEGSDSFWIETEHGSMTPRMYLRDRIIMEYLIDYKHMDIKDIIDDADLNPADLLEEIDLALRMTQQRALTEDE